MVLRHWRRLLILALAGLCYGCAAAPAVSVTPLPTTPAPTAACRYARRVAGVIDDLDAIVSAGEGAGDTTGATWILIFIPKAEGRIGNGAAAPTARQAARAALQAADDLAMAWIRQRAIADRQAEYTRAVQAARQAIQAACGP